jgi:gliding motility-associated-like protein
MITKGFCRLKNMAMLLLMFTSIGVYSQNDCASSIPVTDLTGVVCATSAPSLTNAIGSGGCEEGTLDTWFSFVAQGGSATINVSNGVSGWRPEYVVASSSTNNCSGVFSVVNCVDQAGNYTSISGTSTGLVVGQTYWVIVSSNGDVTTGTISVCVNNPAVVSNCVDNDACVDAATITLNATGGGAACVGDCNNGANPGLDFVGNVCEDSPNPTVWYEFTTAANAATINVSLTSGTWTNPEYTIFVGNSCSTWTTLTCVEGSSGSASSTNLNVTPNTTYVIAVSDATGDQGTFNLCITQNADNSACNTSDALVVSSTSMGSPLNGPYKPGEVVSFCYTITNWTQFNCNYLGAVVPTFGNCWDPSSFNAQGMPVNITTPLNVNGVLQPCPPGPPCAWSSCVGTAAGSWNWFTAGAATYNVNGYYPAGTAMPAGWYFLSSYSPQTNACTGDPTDPDNTYGDGNFPACGTNTFDYTLCFSLTAGPSGNCGIGATDCSVSMKTFADGEFGAWNNLGCTGDIPIANPAGFVCCTAPVITTVSNQTICSNNAINVSLTSNQDPTVTYSWNVVAGANITGAVAGSGSTINQTLINSGASVQTAVYTVTANNGSCTSTTTFTITVTPMPTATISYAGTPFCASVSSAQGVTLTGIGAYTGGTFSSGGGLTINSSTGAITPSTSTPGTYTVTYSIPASGGCPIVPVTTSVTITAVPTAAISYAGTPFCKSISTAQAVTITGTGAYTGGTYSAGVGLSINSATGAITPSTSTAGTYTVTYTIPASGGCPSSPVTTSVTITAVPTATISYAGPFCTSVSSSQNVTLTGTGNYLGGTFSSTGGLTLNSSTGAITPSTSTAGTYTVTYAIPAGAGCPTSNVTTTVVINPIPTFSVAGNSPTTCNGINGSVVISGLSNSTNYNITYNDDAVTVGPTLMTSNGSGQITISGLNAGTYDNIIVSFVGTGCGATNVTGVTLVNPGAPDVFDITNVVICDATYTLPTITGTGLTGSQSYYTGINGTGTPLAAGAVISTSQLLYIYNANGACVDQENFTITINASPTATLTYGTPFCTTLVGVQPVTLTGTNAYTGGTYSSTGGLTINSGTGGITPSSSTPGTYTVTYSIPSSGGCPIVNQTASVTVTAPPTASINYLDPFCAADPTVQPVTLTGTNAYTGGTYSSAGGLSLNATTGNINASTSTVGTYTVTYSTLNSGGCSSVPATTSVTISAAPTATISYPSSPFCTSVSGAQLVTISGTGSYLGGTFASTTGGLNINASSGAVDPSLSTPGTYTVQYTIPTSGGCPSTVVSTTVTITAEPTATIDYVDPFCSTDGTSQAVTLNGTNAYTGGSYSSGLGLSLNTTSGAINASTSTPGTYTVTYNTPINGGCSSVQASTVVEITEAPTATISYLTPYCTSYIGSDGVSLNGTAAYTGGSFSSTGGLTLNTTNGLITPSSSTPNTYTVTYSIPASAGCPSTDVTTSVTIDPVPTFTLTGLDPSTCNASDGSITITGLNNSTTYSVSYNDDGTTVGPNSLTSNASGVITVGGLNSGVYDSFSLTLTGCQGTSSSVITLINPGAPSITDLADQIVCDSYILPAINGTNLSGSQAYWTGTNGTGTQLAVGSAISSSQTIYMYDIVNGVCSNEQSFSVTVNNTPSIVNPGPQVVCDTYLLPVISGTNLSPTSAYYDDSQSNGAAVLTGSITSTQTVWIYSANGACSDEESFLVTINTTPNLVITDPAAVCEPLTVDLTAASVTAGSTNVGTLTYWSDATATTPLATPNSVGTGTYYIQSNNAACDAISLVNVIVNPVPAAPTAGIDTTYCSNWDVVAMTVSGTGGTYTWYSNAGLSSVIGTGSSLTPSTSVGTSVYYVTETLAGCISQASTVSITIQECNIIVPTAFTPDHDGVNDSWEIIDLDNVHPKNVVYVYNRWGALLFQSAEGNYASNPWKGEFEGSELPVGSYYFIIDFQEDDVEPQKGIVSIILNK